MDKPRFEKMEWPQGLQPVEMLYGGERLGGARKFLADLEKAVESYDQLSRHPGMNPEELGRIYGAYWEAVDPEDEEKREKARAALERAIEKRITAGAAIAALAAAEEKKKTEWALYIQYARGSGKSQYLREYMNEMEKICLENGWPYQVRMEGKGLICVRGGPAKGGMQDVAGMAKERMDKRYQRNDPYKKEKTATKTTENR